MLKRILYLLVPLLALSCGSRRGSSVPAPPAPEATPVVATEAAAVTGPLAVETCGDTQRQALARLGWTLESSLEALIDILLQDESAIPRCAAAAS